MYIYIYQNLDHLHVSDNPAARHLTPTGAIVLSTVTGKCISSEEVNFTSAIKSYDRKVEFFICKVCIHGASK